ncbi:MAG TPA: MBG domain-containing protein, partial [Candidatus Dormibacteraeota bacterium]|nr:MBG domain-containing protein [Candidatus Dormibacteraeota bacterium]
ADSSSAVGNYEVVPALADPASKLTNYSVTINNGALAISPATLTVSADSKSKVYGEAVPALTGSLVGVLNGENITASYSTTADATTAAGNHDIVPALSDLDSKLSNYTVWSTNGTLTISPAPLLVTADDKSKFYGDAVPTLTGTLTGVVNGDNITVLYATSGNAGTPVGSYGIVPSLLDPDSKLGNYSVTVTNGSLTINPAALVATADNKSRAYGAANPPLTVSYNGFVNGEDAGIITGTLSISTSAETNSFVGMYPIIASGQTAPNYMINYVNGSLTVLPAELVVQADDKSRAYGHTNPVFTATLTGFVNGEDSTALHGALLFNTTADTNSPLGTYPIEVSGLTSTNYSITFSSGALTITSYALTVTADNQSRAYGSGNPALTGTLSGVQNGDNITASYSTIADSSAPVGPYSIVAALADPDDKLTNYSVTISNGILSVSPAALSVSAEDKSKLYGDAVPALTGSLLGVVNGDNITVSYSTIANAATSVGSYDIVPALSDPDSKLSNYSITFSNGTLTIMAAETSVEISSSQNPATEAASLTFTANVSAVPPVFAQPTGNVQFLTNGISVGSPIALVDGSASFTTVLPSGSNIVTVIYIGDGNFPASTNSLVQIVSSQAGPTGLALRDNNDGTITLTFEGTPGTPYIIQATSELSGGTPWSNVSTNITDGEGMCIYSESKDGQQQRFYRSMKMP